MMFLCVYVSEVRGIPTTVAQSFHRIHIDNTIMFQKREPQKAFFLGNLLKKRFPAPPSHKNTQKTTKQAMTGNRFGTQAHTGRWNAWTAHCFRRTDSRPPCSRPTGRADGKRAERRRRNEGDIRNHHNSGMTATWGKHARRAQLVFRIISSRAGCTPRTAYCDAYAADFRIKANRLAIRRLAAGRMGKGTRKGPDRSAKEALRPCQRGGAAMRKGFCGRAKGAFREQLTGMGAPHGPGNRHRGLPPEGGKGRSGHCRQLFRDFALSRKSQRKPGVSAPGFLVVRYGWRATPRPAITSQSSFRQRHTLRAATLQALRRGRMYPRAHPTDCISECLRRERRPSRRRCR